MPQFSERSRSNLAECHIDLQVIFNEVIKYFDCVVIEGHRPKEEQDAAYAKGMSKVKYPDSKHNTLPSMAVDALPFPIDWKDTDRMKYFAGHVMGIAKLLKATGRITHNLRWGGDWDGDTDLKDNSFMDLPHFELQK